METQNKEQIPKLQTVYKKVKENIGGLECNVARFNLAPVQYSVQKSDNHTNYECPYITAHNIFSFFDLCESEQDLKVRFESTLVAQIEDALKSKGAIQSLEIAAKYSSPKDDRGYLELASARVAYVPLNPVKTEFKWE